MTNRFVRSSFTSPRAVIAVAIFLAAVLAGASSAEGQKNKTPAAVTVTIRCTTTANCAIDGVNDALTDDGLGAYPANAATVSDEGTYINVNGGVTINLLTGVKASPVDRAVTLMFPPDVDPAPSACNRTFTNVAPTRFIFSGNTSDSAGIEAMNVGSSEPGFGKVNFVNPVADGYDFWTLRFTSGTITVTRVTENVWTYESTGASVELECTNSTRRTIIASDGHYSIPFKFTVVK